MLSDLKKALVAHCETSLSQAALEQARISAVAQACSSCTEQINNSNIYYMCVRERNIPAYLNPACVMCRFKGDYKILDSEYLSFVPCAA